METLLEELEVHELDTEDRPYHEIATEIADRDAEYRATQGFGLMTDAMGAAIFYWYFGQGVAGVMDYLSQDRDALNKAMDVVIAASVNESITRSWTAFKTTDPQGGFMGGNKGIIADEIARARHLPDDWGLTFTQRGNIHYDAAVANMMAFLRRTQVAERAASMSMGKLSEPLDRQAFLRQIRSIETDGRIALGEHPSAKNLFNRSTREIRRWAKLNPGEPIPNRLLTSMRGALENGLRLSVDMGIKKRGNRLLKNLVSLTRNFANRAFQRATLLFIEKSPAAKAVKWNLSARHLVADMCDGIANEDMGRGRGVYPIGYVPFPAHVNCLCYLTPVYIGERWSPENPNETRARMEQLRHANIGG